MDAPRQDPRPAQAPAPAAAPAPPAAARWRVLLAFATVYLVWGTTYFAIGEVVHTIPPLLMTSARFLVAGGLLFAWRASRGAPRPTLAHWRTAAALSALLLLGGYGLTAWAQQRVPSGLTALMVSATPVFMVAIDWLRPGGRRPGLPVVAGLALGAAGMVLLIGPARLEAARDADLLSALACPAASLLWAGGSIYSRHAKQNPDVFLAVAMQMATGAGWLALAAVLTGEPHRVSAAMLTPHAFGGWLYLTLAGSLAAYTAYIYLLEVSTPARVSTYAYVNPVIAVFVGWALGGETVTGRILVAAALLLGGVTVITTWRTRHST